MDAARRSKRYPSEQPLAVRCETWAEFVQRYASDIGQGGMFIVTDDAPPILSTIEILLKLPEATDVRLTARVVHVAEANPQTGGKGGIGVEFLDLDAERKKQIHQLIEFARWQGSSGDPNASLARTMWELSPSLPPTKVADVLGASKSPVPATTPSGNPPDAQRRTLDAAERVARRQRAVSGDLRKQTLDEGDPRTRTLDGVEKRARSVEQSRSTLDGTQTRSEPSGPSERAGSAPTDPVKLKLVLTNFAHKRYDHTLKLVAELLESNAKDEQALKWQAMCHARMALAKNDDDAAASHYERALRYDENNREAREFVRTHSRDKRLASLPFGRYFVGKKK